MTGTQRAALKLDSAIDYLKREKWGYRRETFVVVLLPVADADAVSILLSALVAVSQHGG